MGKSKVPLFTEHPVCVCVVLTTPFKPRRYRWRSDGTQNDRNSISKSIQTACRYQHSQC